jgi:hypothetical protein
MWGIYRLAIHTGVKIYVLPGPQVFAFAGDQGQAGRFKFIAETNAANAAVASHPIQYPITLSQLLIAQLQSTGIATNAINVNAILGFLQGGNCHCCVFEGAMQPRNLDQNHYYVALGIGKLSADPFLRFLVDTFCQPGQPPKVHLATFLAVWTVQHVIGMKGESPLNADLACGTGTLLMAASQALTDNFIKIKCTKHATYDESDE